MSDELMIWDSELNTKALSPVYSVYSPLDVDERLRMKDLLNGNY